MINTLAKNLILKAKKNQYHHVHKKMARQVLSKIEEANGKTSSTTIKLADDYAREILGWQGYAPWLYVYSALAGKFKEGWIPDNYYGAVVIPTLKGDYGKIADFKSLSNKLFNNNFFPDIAYFVNGLWLSKTYENINESSIKKFLFYDSDLVVFKTDNSAKGQGVYIIREKEFSTDKISSLGNGVFQSYIEQHDFFKEYMSSSVGTIRITSVLNSNGNFSVRAAFMRFGRTKDTHIQSSSYIRTPINIETGEFGDCGYLPTWETIEKHPDSNLPFTNVRIPDFKKCVATAIDLHKMVPFARVIGWDMVLDKDNNVKVMEWNGVHNDIKFTEATQGPSFADLGWENLWHK